MNRWDFSTLALSDMQKYFYKTENNAEEGAAGSTDTAAGSAEGVEMEVADSTDTTTTTTRRRKKQKRTGKKQGGKLKNETGFRSRRRDRDDDYYDSGGGAGVHTAPSS